MTKTGDVRAAVRAIDRRIAPAMVAATQAVFAPYHAREGSRDVAVARDEQYGADPRQRADLFSTLAGGTRKPIVVYVHGGGFVRGDKAEAGSPYWENVGRWAARNGFVGVTMTYRLAPAATWPAGGEDVGTLVLWLAENAARFGGDPQRIVLIGQSAGATHVASYVADMRHVARRDGVCGVVLMSGVYDFAAYGPQPQLRAYVGEDEQRFRERSPLAGLAATDVPLLFSVAQWDPPAFHAQAALLFDVLFAARGACPELLFLPGHNHISQVANLDAGAAEDVLLNVRLRNFVAQHTDLVPAESV